MWPAELYFFIFVSFIIAGGVKGLIGLGFPTIILAMLTLKIGIRDAMVIMLLPCFFTNVWQALVGGNLAAIIKRIWPLLLTASAAAWITTAFVAGVEARLLSCLLGVIVCIYSVIGLTSPIIITSGRHERWLSPAVGLINGIITGLTGTFVVPGVLYLQSLKIERDKLIQAMGILFLVSTSALGTGLFNHQLADSHLIAFSALALIPSFIGMAAGQKARKYIPETQFQKIFFTALLLLGSYISISSI